MWGVIALKTSRICLKPVDAGEVGPDVRLRKRYERHLHHVASYVKYRRPPSPSPTISPDFDPLDAGDGLRVTSLEPLAVCPLGAVARAQLSVEVANSLA